MKMPTEKWATGDVYEHFMGRWSREIAKKFVHWLNPRAHHQVWMELGCGTGALTESIQSIASPKTIIATDASFDFLQYSKQHLDNMNFSVFDAQSIGLVNNRVDVAVSGLALNFVPNIEQALQEMTRIVKPRGIVGAYVWDYADKMEFLKYFWDSAVALDKTALSVHESKRFPICNPEPLRQLWQDTGLDNVVVESIDMTTRFDNFEQYWAMFTTGSFPAPHYALSLSENKQVALKNHLRDSVPTMSDGSIELIVRAWAVKGIKG